MMEPALAKLAAATGGPVRLSTRPSFAPMVSLMANVEFANYDFFRRASAVYSFSERFRAGFKTALSISPRKILIATSKARIKPWHQIIYRAGCIPAERAARYEAEYFFQSLPCPTTISFRPPQLLPPPVDWLPEGLPASYILLHASAAWRRKAWAPERWAEVLNQLHDIGGGPFVLTGGSAEWERSLAAAITSTTRAPVVDLSGKTSLKGYLATVAKARMVLCIDGSATHLASAFKRPNVTLFGPTDPSQWHFPTARSILIDARTFSPQSEPAVAEIPAAAVCRTAVDLWTKASAASE